MIAMLVCLANLLYGFGQAIRMWRRRKPAESALLLFLTLLIAGYFVPFTASYLPTVQKVNQALFEPVSDYVLHLLQIRTEVP